MLRFLLLCALFFSAATQAQIFKRDPGDEIVLPDEEALQLPPAPRDENLVRFDPGFNTPLNYYIDGASLKAGKTDRIVRYTLVVRSSAGANNISFEALRCDTGDRKIYAYGGSDGKWSPARDPQWKPVETERYRRTLFVFYFCPNNLPFESTQEGIDALRNGGHRRAPRDSY